MEPLTVAGAGLAVLGSKDLLNKLLGPSCDYIGAKAAGLIEKTDVNLDEIFSKAAKRLGEALDNKGSVPPRILKHIWDEGRFCNDELTQEYFAGLLISARTESGENDAALQYVSVVKELSSFQIKLHYAMYLMVKQFYSGSGNIKNIQRKESQQQLGVKFDGIELFKYLGLTVTGKDNLELAESIFAQSVHGLLRLGLLSDAMWGRSEELKHRWGTKTEVSVTLYPSAFGAELAMWASSLSEVPTKFFLVEGVKLHQVEQYVPPKKSIAVGPKNG